MASFTPVMLSGDNLGQRHRHLNSLVRNATESGVPFHHVEARVEQSPVDRLFKIDLAIKLHNVDYIILSLKDDDMIYVSRALKCPWLLDHRDIINPKYLEDILFPEMLKPAVSKMKHWLYINLRNAAMCQEFYQYYKENTFEFAIKFLSHCNHEFILDEVPKILTKLTVHYLKVLSEACPRVAKVYFDSLATDEDVKYKYLGKEQSYYNSVKCVLKSDPDVFLSITEKYFNINSFKRLSSSATDYILRHHKSRFENKLELYVAYLLHIPTVADRLSEQECQEAVLKLARAKYLQHWFRYKVVEPLIKRISPDKRAAFKKRVFVDKHVGEGVDEWPYELPNPPPQVDCCPHVFEDQDFVSINGTPVGMALQRAKCCFKSAYRAETCMEDAFMIRIKTDLDRLFGEFRFIGFERALHDLGMRMAATGSADRRRDMFLVLVSKTGGRIEAVSDLLRLAVRHSNEPAHTRAAVLRSLVKRANVWRLPADVWQYLLDFGHGLGLDGSKSEAACREGLHAVVIRQLLTGECEQAVTAAFLNDFSTLAEYSLKADERKRVAIGLQNMLVAAATDVTPAVAAKRLGQLLDTLKEHRVSIEPASPAVKAVMSLASHDAEVARPLLERLYNAKIARRELLRINLAFRRDQAALVNALRHDPPALDLDQIVEMLAVGESCFDGFISKLVIYFDQKEDITTKLRTAIKENITKKQNVKLARPLAGLMGNALTQEIRELDAAGTEFVKFAAALRASAHRARPVINLTEWGWRKAGVKAVATRAMRCREVEKVALTRALATERRTVRVALSLSMLSKEELLLDSFALAAKLRPTAALRAALPYFRRHGDSANLKVWDIVKPLISSVDLSSNLRLRRLLRNTDWIPSSIKPDYCVTLYFAINKISRTNADQVLRELSNLLHKSSISIESILIQILENTDKNLTAISTPAIFVRYLMLSRNDEDLKERFAKVGDRFLERLDSLRCEDESCFEARLDQVMESLKYNAAFLDTKFTSCLIVIERFIAWMQKFMPKEQYFRKYVQVHLTMLYFKAIRQSMKQMPEVFADPKRRKTEGVDAVGFIFGRYIAKEAAELVCTYFDSVIELYTSALVDYLSDNFMYGSSRAKLTVSMLKGIMAEGVGNQRRVAVYVFNDRQYDMEDSVRKEIKELMTKDKEIEFFVHAELLT